MSNELEQLPYEALIERSMNSLQAKNQFHCETWKLDEADWSVDQDEGTIIFHAPDNIMATAPVQIIGTYDQSQGSWMWSWANTSIDSALAQDAIAVKAYGERKDNALLTARVSQIEEYDAWQLTALACELNQQQGVYRGIAGHTLIFMTFGDVSLQQN
ncbi:MULTISPECIES: DUF6882 domain-containing protein [Providencia]|jgi:hypothetical protein|uniref:DUF6882 domain-containing protein n=1 Tax=Providencia TaxID=586 RepID=UPI001C5B3076|nr:MULTISPECIES: DUF6882 domain-containing protein [Providencia]ELR5152732.1 hypothetical protein [Providencia rettgeri]ELR5232279.1 hypothetical protein [Providencia rettgeri]MDR2226021.1 hypothetical protein [Providencia sp.]QXX82454.1 hypothetical protein J6836_19945 [Providencia sp. R33]